MADEGAPSAVQGSLSAARSFARPAASASNHSRLQDAQTHQPSGGMKLEAVMETLQRQQAARLVLEEKLRVAEQKQQPHVHQQALDPRHYQAAMRAGGGPAFTLSHREDADMRVWTNDQDGGDTDNQEITDEEENDGSSSDLPQQRPSALRRPGLSTQGARGQLMTRVPGSTLPAPSSGFPTAHHHEWTYEEQFKQLYELDDDEKRKGFLDDLFYFMQQRGTPVNRIPIMAKQVLDLYNLYKLVTEKGGLVEVINKKIWREITKGLNLPTSITSAAFTLRTQYMKYLYPYECEKRGLSSPDELQAAIDSNRREGRKQNYGSVIFSYTPSGLSTPKIQPHVPTPAHSSSPFSQAPVVKKENHRMARCLHSGVALSLSPSSHHEAALAVQAAVTQSAALEHRKKIKSSEPPLKKMMMVAEEQQRITEHILHKNLITMATQLPLNIKLSNRDDRQEAALNLSTNGISSINMSIEINGVVYTGVLFARQSSVDGMMEHRGKHSYCKTQGKTNAT
ncbi:AT-rich interactive domain-containing protein 3A [Nothobranchius furzeri]